MTSINQGCLKAVDEYRKIVDTWNERRKIGTTTQLETVMDKLEVEALSNIRESCDIKR